MSQKLAHWLDNKSPSWFKILYFGLQHTIEAIHFRRDVAQVRKP